MREPRSTPRALKAAALTAEAQRLSVAGYTQAEIAAAQCRTQQAVSKSLRRAIRGAQAAIAADAEVYLGLELARLDGVVAKATAAWEAEPGRKNPKLLDAILKAGEQRARLLKLDAATPTVLVTQATQAGGLDLSKLSNDQLDAYEDALRTASGLPPREVPPVREGPRRPEVIIGGVNRPPAGFQPSPSLPVEAPREDAPIKAVSDGVSDLRAREDVAQDLDKSPAESAGVARADAGKLKGLDALRSIFAR